MPDTIEEEREESRSSPDEEEEIQVEEQYVDAMDTACCECDDGGVVLSCEGSCLRCFHIGLDQSENDDEYEWSAERCNPLKLPKELALRLISDTDEFQCPNCLADVQQCFKCNIEGNSNPCAPFGPDTVARCAVFNCGRFYHPNCIGKFSEDMHTTSFICPQHECLNKANGQCKLPHDEDAPLIPCRRCPTAMHECCIPRRLMNTKDHRIGKRVWLAKGRDSEGNFLGDPVDRSLIYCFNHKIPKGKENPPLQADLFMPDLLSSWRQKACLRNLDLPSSKEWLIANKEFKLKADYSSYTSFVPLARLKSKPAHKKRKSDSIAQQGGLNDGLTPLDADEADPRLKEEPQDNDEPVGVAAEGDLPNRDSKSKGAVSKSTNKSKKTLGSKSVSPEEEAEGKVQQQRRTSKRTMSSREASEKPPTSKVDSKQTKAKIASTEDVEMRQASTASGTALEQHQAAKTYYPGWFKTNRNARLDVLYEAFQEGYKAHQAAKPSTDPAHATLQRASLTKIVDYLIESCDLGEESQVIDLGSGMCRVLWHMSLAVGIKIAAGLDNEWHETAQEFNETVNEYLYSHGVADQFPFREPHSMSADIMGVNSHHSATHMFVFWDAFPKALKKQTAKVFDGSPMMKYIVAIQRKPELSNPELTSLGFPNVQCIKKFSHLKMDSIPGDQTAFIFEKSTFKKGSSLASTNTGS